MEEEKNMFKKTTLGAGGCKVNVRKNLRFETMETKKTTSTKTG